MRPPGPGKRDSSPRARWLVLGSVLLAVAVVLVLVFL